jgi:hypothetical protein
MEEDSLDASVEDPPQEAGTWGASDCTTDDVMVAGVEYIGGCSTYDGTCDGDRGHCIKCSGTPGAAPAVEDAAAVAAVGSGHR